MRPPEYGLLLRVGKSRDGGEGLPIDDHSKRVLRPDVLPSMMRRYAVVLPLACVSTISFGQEVSPTQGVTRDWGGLRTRLYQQGVDF
jgi:hypothetical protein